MLTSSRLISVFLIVLLATGLFLLDREAMASAPVPLSTCTFDSNRNVTIGGSGGCGPTVYVDQSYTGTSGLGSITIASGGTLVFDNKNSSGKLDTSGIIVNGTLRYTTLCPYAPTLAPVPALPPPLPSVATIADLNDPAQCPNGECYFYDSTSGLLFINVVQEQPNAGGPYSSPLGSCAGNKDADGICADKSFYSCPGPGCELYTIQVDSSYTPGSPSACTPYGGSVDYTQPYPSNLNQLAYSNNTPIQTALHGANGGFPHNELTNLPTTGFCPIKAPTQPDWPSAPKNRENSVHLGPPGERNSRY